MRGVQFRVSDAEVELPSAMQWHDFWEDPAVESGLSWFGSLRERGEREVRLRGAVETGAVIAEVEALLEIWSGMDWSDASGGARLHDLERPPEIGRLAWVLLRARTRVARAWRRVAGRPAEPGGEVPIELSAREWQVLSARRLRTFLRRAIADGSPIEVVVPSEWHEEEGDEGEEDR